MKEMNYPEYRSAIGEDSHRFLQEGLSFSAEPAPAYPGNDSPPLSGPQAADPENLSSRSCILGGVVFEDCPPLQANSDGDVVLHALTRAVSGITGRNILGAPADQLVKRGVTDSSFFVALAMEDLKALGFVPVHASFSIECKTPKIDPHVDEMKAQIAKLLLLFPGEIGITAMTGEGLTAFGRGEGIRVTCILTVRR